MITITGNISSNRKQELCRTLASNLSTLREKANLKQDELADKLGISRQNISAIETGKHVMQWSTFSMLVMFFAKDKEMKQIMTAMRIIDEEVEKTLSIAPEGQRKKDS